MAPAEILNRIAALYGWSDDDLRGEHGLPRARRFAPPEPLAAGLEFKSRVPLAPGTGHFADHYIGGGGRHLIVTIAEYSSAPEARAHLGMVLAHCMLKAPRCEAAGEICYGGEDAGTVMFVRRNVFAQVASVGTTHSDVATVAAEADRQLLDHIAAQEGSNDAEPI